MPVGVFDGASEGILMRFRLLRLRARVVLFAATLLIGFLEWNLMLADCA